MTVERRVPKVMKEEASVEAARVENTEYGICPICQKSMKFSIAGTHQVLVCLEHSIVMPVRDESHV